MLSLRMPRSPRLGKPLVAAAMVAALAPAAAADPVLGNGPARGKPLNLAQLRACLEIQERLESQGAAMQKLQSELDTARADFQRFDAELQAERAALDRGSKAAVDAYNARLDERRRRVADYEARTPALAETVAVYNALRQELGADCDDRPYDEDDYAAIFSAR
jgi:hypothetical protein